MFEQTSRLAEQLATSLSRRRFLGSLGGCAAAAALGVAGVLTLRGHASAADGLCPGRCCNYGSCGIVRVSKCEECAKSYNGCDLLRCLMNMIRQDGCLC
jgi:hypothetical protein